MGHDRDVTPDVDDTTVSVISSLYDMRTLLSDGSDAHEDSYTVLHESVQTTSHSRIVSNEVHEHPVSVHGEPTRTRAVATVLAANIDAEKEAEGREDKHKEC